MSINHESSQSLLQQPALSGYPRLAEDAQAWLEALDGEPLANAVNLSLQNLSSLNRESLPGTARLTILEAFLGPYRDMAKRSRQVRDRSRGTIKGLRPINQVAHELALSYHLIVRNILDDLGGERGARLPGAEADLLATALERAIRFTGELILDYLARYLPPRDQAWYAIQQLYLHAEQQALSARAVPSPNDGPRTTIRRTFKRIVLTSLANPYQLTHGALWHIHDHLETRPDWLDLAQLLTPASLSAPQKPGEPPSYLIDLGADRGPRPLIEGESEGLRASQHRLLDVRPLTATVRRHIASEHTGMAAGAPAPDPEQPDVGQLLRHAVLAWERAQRRKQTRHAREGWIEAIFGFERINAYIHAQIERYRTHSGSVENRRLACRLVNESRGGLCLELPADEHAELAVGQLLLASPTGQFHSGEVLIVGAIRWLNDLGDSGYRFGIETLGHLALPVTLSPDDAPDQPTDALLILSSSEDMEGILVSPPQLYRSGRSLHVAGPLPERADQRTRVIATENVEVAADHVRFRYAIE